MLLRKSGATEGSDPHHRWIVDPLDGTTNFLHGIPHFAISIALERDGEIVAGIVYEPTRDEMFWAEKGIGAYRQRPPHPGVGPASPRRGADRHRHPVRRARRPSDAISRRSPRVMAATSGVRRLGAAALDLAYVAAGRYDGFWEFGLSPWDIAAGLLLVREAGGFVSDLSGGQTMMTSGDVLAANGHLHLPLAALIRQALRAQPAA